MSNERKKLFYKIGEVCEIFQVEPHVLRYWESEFRLLSPAKNRAGQRIYRQEDLELIERIRSLLYEDGYTIAGARKRLREESTGKRLPLFKDSSRAARRAALSEIRKDLEEILEILDE